VALVEQSADLVAFFEAVDAGAGLENGAGGVGAWDYGKGYGERVFSLAQYQHDCV
jgi:hypothetical protein